MFFIDCCKRSTFDRTASVGLASLSSTGQRKVLRVFSSCASVSARAKRNSTLSKSSIEGKPGNAGLALDQLLDLTTTAAKVPKACIKCITKIVFGHDGG